MTSLYQLGRLDGCIYLALNDWGPASPSSFLLPSAVFCLPPLSLSFLLSSSLTLLRLVDQII
jgi:hypothetical protein